MRLMLMPFGRPRGDRAGHRGLELDLAAVAGAEADRQAEVRDADVLDLGLGALDQALGAVLEVGQRSRRRRRRSRSRAGSCGRAPDRRRRRGDEERREVDEVAVRRGSLPVQRRSVRAAASASVLARPLGGVRAPPRAWAVARVVHRHRSLSSFGTAALAPAKMGLPAGNGRRAVGSAAPRGCADPPESENDRKAIAERELG